MSPCVDSAKKGRKWFRRLLVVLRSYVSGQTITPRLQPECLGRDEVPGHIKVKRLRELVARLAHLMITSMASCSRPPPARMSSTRLVRAKSFSSKGESLSASRYQDSASSICGAIRNKRTTI